MNIASMFGAAGLLLALTGIGHVQAELDNQQSIVPDPDAVDQHEFVPNRIFVRFDTTKPTSVRSDVLTDIEGSVQTEYWLVPGLTVIETPIGVREALSRLEHHAGPVLYAEPIYVVHAFDTIPNDALYNTLYGMDQIRAPQAWDEHQGDQEFVIAVIDTGIDYNHPDLVDNIWTNPGEIAGNGQDDDGNGYVDDVHGYDFYSYEPDPMDSNGHGTHCGGTIGGVGDNGVGVAGVNWRCRLVGAQFLSSGGSGSTQGAIDAVQYCVANCFKVSNNSWGGGGYTQGLFDAIENAGDLCGHVFVAAAGNGGYNGASYPAAYTCSNILSVAATDSNEQLASFSQYSATEVDLGAPGVDVNSTTPGNNYSYYSGTSMATPHVAGGVGLVYSVMGNSSAEEIIEIITSTVRPISALQGITVTGGVLNVADALDATFLGPQITFLGSVPDEIDPGVEIDVQVNIDPREDQLVLGSVKLHYRSDASSGWMTIGMDPAGPINWSASVPGMSCGDDPEFYLSCQGQQSGLVTYPSGGSANAFNWLVGSINVAYDDPGEVDGTWTVSTTAVDGGWTRGVPVSSCSFRGAPGNDGDGSGACWVTDNSSASDCNSDVDEGTTTLTSGVISLPEGDNILSYYRWFHNSYGDNPYTDTLLVEYSTDGLNWSNLETVGPAGDDVDGGWVLVTWDVNELVGSADQIQLRFTAGDVGTNTQSVVEAGVDGVLISAIECDDQPAVPGDVTGDGLVNVDDILSILSVYGENCECPQDLNGDGEVGVDDILLILGYFTG
ncbi:MAG: S8 family serine peptidase [Phycisphaerales bacterium]|nr:S8 family serine peptidase [Phycisphaerales bacterium]